MSVRPYFFRSSGSLAAATKAGISTLSLAIAGLASPALAQQSTSAATEEPEDIVVTGFRGALQSAQSRKQNSDTIVDGVTAEDIGALPDRSVTETLQRVPGISISRFAAGNDPDHFSAEGSGVVVRGLNYVRSEINGRDAFTANNGRGLGFADVPSELLAGVEVFKAPTADRIEGGLAGTVNLRTRVPLDNRGFHIAGSMEINYSDFVKKSSPTASVVISNTFETGIGEIGLLASASYSQLFTRADRFQLSSFRARNLYTNGTRNDVVPFTGATTSTSRVILPRGAVMGSEELDRRRLGLSAAAQWKSNDGRAEAVFQFLRSDARLEKFEETIEIATDNVAGNGDSRAVVGTSLAFDNTGLFSSGTITGPTGWRDDQNVNVTNPTAFAANPGGRRTPVFGLQSNNIRQDSENRTLVDDYSANFRFNASDNLTFNLDYQHVKSTVDVGAYSFWTSSYQDANIKLNGSNLPSVTFVPPQNCPTLPCVGAPGSSANHPTYFVGTRNSYSDPYNTFYRAAMDHIEESEGELDAIRFDAEYRFPNEGFLKSVKLGARYADRKQTARFSIYNWGNLSEQWGGGGPVWLDENVDGIARGTGGAPINQYKETCFTNFFQGQVANPLNGSCRLTSAVNAAAYRSTYYDYATRIAAEFAGTNVGADGVTRTNGFNPLGNRPGLVPGTSYLPGEINDQTEKNKAAYIMTRFGADLGFGELSGNAGVRYTRTDRRSNGYFQIANNPGSLPTEAVCTAPPAAGATLPAFCSFSVAQRNQARGFLNGFLAPTSVDTVFDYWLPSLNLKLDVGGGVQFRAAYFKGVSPPEFGYTRNFQLVSTLTVSRDTDAAGNPIPGSERISVSNPLAANPRLLPITADNFDLTAEYYFAKLGQFSLSGFYKRLTGVVTQNTRRVDFTNNGVTYSGVLTLPENSSKVGTVKGFEVSYQGTFSFLPGFLKGLGVQANYTYVDASGVPQTTLSFTDPDVAAGRQSTIPGDNFPLERLSKHTVNITPFIDIGPLSARVSYNWRSRYLLTLRDVITPFDPIYQDDYGQVDASITFALTKKVKIGIQGVNLNNATTKTLAAIYDVDGRTIRLVPRGWFTNDRRFSAVLRLAY
jgi:TonB-dependent receptor